ncbi:MAG: hypothetical protein KKG99_03750 [Bacteroidetes bacterium]|nr:hypothetical protein [Bacteroidota bacterium]
MFSIHALKTIARYEMRTLLRGWFFRIFAGLTILGLGGFNLAVFLATSGSPWIYRALPASMPYVNLLILNLGQAIVAVFLASEFLKQDRKNDTIEVIYVRSMTNAEYILGKTIGILYVFLVLNLFILLMGIGFSFISNDSAKGISEFFYYPLLISLPTLVFILGLSFFIMTIFKNQAITFIVILGYIALTIFYLNTKYYHIFDYIAYQVPMFNSSIAGFGNIQEVLIHRGMYFFIGLGMVFFTIFKLQRLPQAKKLTSFPLIIAIIFISVGGLLARQYIKIKESNVDLKKQMISLNNQYVHYPKVSITDSKIELQHLGERLKAKVEMQFINSNNQLIDTLIFSLNPSLSLISANIDGKDVTYNRDLHLIKIFPGQDIEKGRNYSLTLEYEGRINENTHFLDTDLENYTDNFSLEIFRIRKRYAYLKDDFVCLTSESLWYPISGVGYSPLDPSLYYPDNTKFHLTVKTKNGLLPISQGKMAELNESTYQFEPEFPLPKISLLIGNYTKYSIRVDSVDYNLFTIKGNEYYISHFTNISDSLPGIIRSLKNEYENHIGLDYPFERFSLAEVPVQFALDKHSFSMASDAVQPEIVFYSEKGVTMEETDFKKRRNQSERQMKRDNEEISPEELQTRIFKRFVRGNFMANSSEWYQFEEVVDRNTYSIFPNYYSFITQLRSKDWPMLDLALGIYLKDRNENAISSNRWFFEGISKGERVNLELKKSSLEELMSNGISKQTESEEHEDLMTLNDVILAKGDYLFSLFQARYGKDAFNQFLNNLIAQNQHHSFSFETFNNDIQRKFNDSISTEIQDWYSKRQLPGFLIKDLQTYKVLEGEFTKYQLKFKISNPEDIDGLVTVNVDLNNQEIRQDNNQVTVDFSREIHIPAHTAREVGFVFSTEPNRMNIYTHISENLPNNIIYDFDSFEEIKKIASFDDILSCEMFTSLQETNEIIVDNEDTGFEFVQTSNRSYLKTLVDKNKVETYKYVGIRYWNPPTEWKPVLRSGFYGKYVRSAMYTSSSGEERTAVWHANLTEGAYYDVYCHIEKINIQRRNRNRKPDYNFKIYHEAGVEQINLTDEELENGWNYLGSYYISPESAKVELLNKSVGQMIFADAIKWVKNN